MDKLIRVRIVAVSCDLYSDCAPAWEYLFRTHWPECLYPLCFVTNSEPLSVQSPVHYIKGKDIDYGGRMRRFIKAHCHPDDVLLLTMADYMLKHVDVGLVERAISLMRKDSGVWHIRLRPMPPPRLPYSDDFGGIDKTSRYALSLQSGLWRASTAYNLFRDGENPWDTEQNGSGRVKGMKGSFLSVRTMAMPHINYYNKRSVLPGSISWVRNRVPKELWPDACRDSSLARTKVPGNRRGPSTGPSTRPSTGSGQSSGRGKKGRRKRG